MCNGCCGDLSLGWPDTTGYAGAMLSRSPLLRRQYRIAAKPGEKSRRWTRANRKGLEMIPPFFALRPPEQRPVQIGSLRFVELVPDPVIRIQYVVHNVLWIVEGGQDLVAGPLRIHHFIVSVTALVLLVSLFRRQAQPLGPDVAQGEPGRDAPVRGGLHQAASSMAVWRASTSVTHTSRISRALPSCLSRFTLS
jgi:hypothetical protein